MYSGANNDTIRDALFVLSHEALCVHRAIGELVKAGWYSSAAALARTLFDISPISPLDCVSTCW
jgi:hypothetical protein